MIRTHNTQPKADMTLFQEAEEDFTPTPLEDILRPVSAFMPEPLDTPDDRFVPLEDLLYLSGSAFARPTGALDEHQVTARKRESEANPNESSNAITDLAMPETLTEAPELDLVKPDYPVDTQEAQNPQTGEWSRPTLERGKRFATPEEAAYALLREAQTITLNDHNAEKREVGGFVQVGLDERTGNYFYYFDKVTPGDAMKVQMSIPPNSVGMVHTHTVIPGNEKLNKDNERLSEEDAKIINRYLVPNRPVLNGKVYNGPVFGGLATPSGKIRFFYGPKFHEDKDGIATKKPTFSFGN